MLCYLQMSKRMSQVVRASKFRHVFGTKPTKTGTFWTGAKMRPSDVSYNMAATAKYVAYISGQLGGRQMVVLDKDKPERLPASVPAFTHGSQITDIAASPHNDSIFATAGDDATFRIWQVPEGGLKAHAETPLADFDQEHDKKISLIRFHPTVADTVVSASFDKTAKIWDVSKGAPIVDFDTSEVVTGIDWSYDGGTMFTASKDKMVRAWDARKGGVAAEIETELLAGKVGRVHVLGNKNRIAVLGPAKNAERVLCIYDQRKLGDGPMAESARMGTGSGNVMSHYDTDTGVMFVAAKGEAQVKYYEMIDDAKPYYYFLSVFQGDPIKGAAFAPKRMVDYMKCEVVRMYALSSREAIQPIPFVVPRKASNFQKDIFPETFTGEPTVKCDEWMGGAKAEPKTGDIQSLGGGVAASVSVGAGGSGGAAKGSGKAPKLPDNVDLNPRSLHEAKNTIKALQAHIKALEAMI